jgi:hypothetical protein
MKNNLYQNLFIQPDLNSPAKRLVGKKHKMTLFDTCLPKYLNPLTLGIPQKRQLNLT